jgi:hypothetical protein
MVKHNIIKKILMKILNRYIYLRLGVIALMLLFLSASGLNAQNRPAKKQKTTSVVLTVLDENSAEFAGVGVVLGEGTRTY